MSLVFVILIWESAFVVFLLWKSMSITSVVFLIFFQFGVVEMHANIFWKWSVKLLFCFKKISFYVMSKASQYFGMQY